MSICRGILSLRLKGPINLISRWMSYNVMHPGRHGESYGDVQIKNKNICDHSKEGILKIVGNLISKPHPENEPFTVAEYGAADGSISMELMTDIICLIRSKCGKNKEINIMYEDLPMSDFNSLHKRIHGIIPNPRSYLLDHENVYVTSTGTNFYKQCFPSNSVDLALSFTATHWLSNKVDIFDHVYPYFTQNKDEIDALEKQAADDWVLFLTKRTKELKPGGWGVFSTLGTRDATEGKPAFVAGQDILNKLNEVWNRLFSRGIITKAELKRGTLGFCLRSPRQIEEPILDSIEIQNGGLKLHEIRLDTIPYFLEAEWNEMFRQGNKEREAFARDFLKYLKTPFYSTFYEALEGQRNEEQKLQICELLFKEARDFFLSKYPSEFDIDYIVTTTYVFKE
ncbi:uncharacterized protein LOC126823796 [Patella vulgata]|uniref:uncharacterized protein LOC126823796 n=1 Tax=Patella vulgata TaxID=6465 RepID=UPI00217F8140|nr:uncharacterized protein LOC126823796 [Patella vulgata]